MKKTKNYAQFVLFEDFHRKSSREYLEKLEQEILRDNRLKENPIDVTERFEICDGRHRFIIAKKHNLPIYYRITYKSTEYYKWMEENYEAYHEEEKVLFLTEK